MNIKVDNNSIVPINGKSFHFRINLHTDLIQSFIGYMSLFNRYCSVTKNKKVFFNIKQDVADVVIELGISADSGLDNSKTYLEEYLGFISNKDKILSLEDYCEINVDEDQLKNFKIRLLEQRKHLLIVFKLEFGLQNIIEFSESNFLNEVEFEEIDRITKTYELEIENYQTLIELIRHEEKNKYLAKENCTLKEQILKIEEEKNALVSRIITDISDKISNANNIVNGTPDKQMLEDMIAKNKMKEVFSALKLTDDSELRHTIIINQSQWNELQRRQKLGMLKTSAYLEESNRICLTLLQIINDL